MSFYNRIDPVLIERLLPESIGENQSGVYAQAYRLLDAGQNFAYLFAILLLPLFSKMIKYNESTEKLVKLSFSIIISGVLIIAITSQFYADDLMNLMYYPFAGETQDQFDTRIIQSALIFRLLMFSFVAIASNYIFGTLLTANNNLKQLNIIAFCGLVVNLTLNFILIPQYMAVGSAWASAVTQVMTAIAQLFIVQREFNFKLNVRLITNLITLTITLFVFGFISNNYLDIRWELSSMIMIVFGICSAMMLKLIHIREFIEIINHDIN